MIQRRITNALQYKNDREIGRFLTSANTLNFWYSDGERTPLYNRPRMNEGYAIFAVNRYKFIHNYCWQLGVPTGNRTPNWALGGLCYIRLTMRTRIKFIGYSNIHFGELVSPWLSNLILSNYPLAQMHDFVRFSHHFAPFWWAHIRNRAPLVGACYIHLSKEALCNHYIIYYPFLQGICSLLIS